MVVTEQSDERLEFRHDGIAGAQPMLWIVIACVALAAIAALFGGSILSLIVVLAIGAVFVALLRKSSAESVAVFDRGKGTATIVHRRGQSELERTEKPLGEIDRVIVDAASRSSRRDNIPELRPALLIGTAIVPLTWRAFVSGNAPVDAALALRRFLGHPADGLFEESVAALAKYSGRVNPAVRLARHGLGLSRLDAAALVTRLKRSE